MKFMLIVFSLISSGNTGFGFLTTETFDSMESCEIAKGFVTESLSQSYRYTNPNKAGIFASTTEIFAECKEVK